MKSENQELQWFCRAGIFLLQLVVIAALLWTSESSLARDDDGGNYTPPCQTEECKKTHPAYNTIPIPYHYKKSPPDVGTWYHRGGEDGGRVWVPGLTDDMDDGSKEIYYEMKGGPLKAGWSVVRVDVASAIQLAQDYPSTECHDNMAAAASGKVQMDCTYTKNGKKETKSFRNITTVSFDQFLDDNFLTVSEYHQNRMNSGSEGTNGSNSYGQYYDSHGNLIYAGGNGTNGSSSGRDGGVGFSRAPAGTTTAYARYINNHVAKNYDSIHRSTSAVFSQGQEKQLTLEEILQKKEGTFSPSLGEKGGKGKSDSSAAAKPPQNAGSDAKKP